VYCASVKGGHQTKLFVTVRAEAVPGTSGNGDNVADIRDDHLSVDGEPCTTARDNEDLAAAVLVASDLVARWVLTRRHHNGTKTVILGIDET
jgi:hypothetical protein